MSESDILTIIVTVAVLLFLIPAFIPTFKWFLISSSVIVLCFIGVWVKYNYDVSQANHTGSPGEGLGLAFIMLLHLSFLLGLILRGCIWLVKIKINEIRNREIKNT